METKGKEIVRRILAGESQTSIAADLDVTQQFVSKVWRKHAGGSLGRGGDRRGGKYQRALARAVKRVKARKKGSDGKASRA